MAVTPAALFEFATSFAAKQGRDPKVRECARRFRVRNADILDAAEDAKGRGLPLDLTVGWRCGSGIAAIERESDYEVEAYGTPDDTKTG